LPPVSEVRDPFRIRDHVAEFDQIVAEIIARSEKTRQRVPNMLDRAYGSAASEKVDIFFPAERSPAMPVHMFIHGGYWRMFSKRDYSYIADTITAAGAIAVIVDYALMPSVRMSVLVDQVQRALDWVVTHVGELGGDPARLTVSGHSAGAHLATFLFNESDRASAVRAALLLGGLYKLAPLQHSFLQHEIALTDHEVRAFSPMNQEHQSSTRVSMLVGAEETEPFHRQAEEFAALLRRQGANASLGLLPGANHMSSVRDLGVPSSDAGKALTALISTN
jgi:arylformamidase